MPLASCSLALLFFRRGEGVVGVAGFGLKISFKDVLGGLLD